MCTLLIAAAVLPVAGTMNVGKTTNVEKSILGDEELVTEPSQQYGRQDDFDWQVSGNNVFTGHGGSYPSGNVGIGTTSPTNKLHIVGSDSAPLLNVEKTGSGRGVRVSTTSACAIWVENAGNHGLRVTNAAGDGVHVTQAGGWAGFFGGKGYFSDNVGIGTLNPSYLLDVSGGSDIVAQFSGRVIGADAVNDDEFVTKGQVESISTSLYTPTGTSDPNGNLGDTVWDSNYFYVKTSQGWKRAALETWESTSK